ncbi:MAG: GFA family protein [Pseudomonadota bacterium]
MTVAIEGGCLCGAVRYRVTGRPLESVYCHCRQCQLSAGAPVIAWLNVPRAKFEYHVGEASSFASSGRAVREYCRQCGTQLVFRSLEHTDTIDINVHTLDEPDRYPAEYHIFFDERVPWMNYEDGLPRYAGEATDD